MADEIPDEPIEMRAVYDRGGDVILNIGEGRWEIGGWCGDWRTAWRAFGPLRFALPGPVVGTPPMADHLHAVVFNSLSRELGARKRFVSRDEREEIAACIVAQLREEHLHVNLNHAALERLVRNAMGAGVACASERFRAGEVDRDGSLLDVFGDFPSEFLSIRGDLIEALHDVAGES